MKSEKCIAVFGGSSLQLPLIRHCKELNIRTVVLDPDIHAFAKDFADVFEVMSGDDFTGTCELIEKYHVNGLITSSTDKPLVMMARIAEKFKLPFISKETAVFCTDKYKMKQVFLENQIDCAFGILVSEAGEIPKYPAIIKPLDNSGSRGVYYCSDKKDAEMLMLKAKLHTKQNKILCEEFLSGDEYSVESIHYNDFHHIVQITEKIISPFPYQVEMGHIAPAHLSEGIKKRIEEIVKRIALAFNYNHCAAHTEFKIKDGKISVIETSPRLGGDFITSMLVPLSSGINLENCLINLSMGGEINVQSKNISHSAIFYFKLPNGIIRQIDNLEPIKEIPGVVDFYFSLKVGDRVDTITSSLDRNGYFIISLKTRKELIDLKEKIFLMINERILINENA